MNIEGYVTAEEGAELLGIQRRSLYLYVRRADGFPQPVTIGRSLLFERAALVAWRATHPARKRTKGETP
ncbi:helix-turn-helix transcriptional regulator [Streptomyces sioyaensis]|uniref:helix-turn-helix transcriptional regulator n=1 Tax=Streptomyces sioyaensis TaxID=67364 RepID=UPI0037A91910